MKKNLASLLSPLALRHRAEAAASGLPALMAAAEKAVATLHSGEHAQRKAGSGEKFWQFRSYDSGDRPQDIDWRQSAKGDHLFVREKEQQTAQTALFWVQNDKGMDLRHVRARASKYESGIILSLALGLLLTRSGEHVGALNEPARTGRGGNALDYLGHSLYQRPAHLPDGPSLPLASLVPKRSSIILCGDFMHPPAAVDMSLNLLATQNTQGLVVQILDPAEVELPFVGRAIFRPLDDSREFPIANVPAIRKAYTDRLNDHIATIRNIARRHRFGHVLYVTRDDPRAALNAAWQILAPRMHGQGGF